VLPGEAQTMPSPLEEARDFLHRRRRKATIASSVGTSAPMSR
jgi:hypothetical protein